MTDTIATDNPLSPSETRTLATLVSMMIPASDEYGVPGADDDTIVADILGTAKQHVELLQAGLKDLDTFASEHGAPFVELDHDARMGIVERQSDALAAFIRVVTSITVQCYYRDSRVMESLGMEARPPYPKGFDVPQGDWSMLDPVRDRGKIWRDA